MADVSSMSLQLTKKYNLGNYESEEISVFMTVRPDEDEDPNEAWEQLFIRCRGARDDAARELGLKTQPVVTRKPPSSSRSVPVPPPSVPWE